MITVEGLKKNYKINVKKGIFKREQQINEAVKGIDMQIKPGEIVGLLGLNGAGKTTTIKMLSTLIEPDGGKGDIDGMDLIKNAFEIKKIINMIAGGERMIYWRLTAKENLEYFGKLYNLPKKLLKNRIDELLSFVGLTEKMNVPVEQYSKGMKQRLQIARGLINDPKYIFMDEPTLGLDAPIAREVRKYTKKLARENGKGILLTSHYMNEIEELCDYVYIIDKGRKVMEGSPRDVISIAAKNTNKYIIRLESFSDKLKNNLDDFIKSVSSEYKIDNFDNAYDIEISSNKDIQSELITLLSANAKVLSFKVQEPNLEDAIIKLLEVS
ncbi:MAG: ABC transporter ATP-binding protein [Clostridiaceae bacterium]